MILLKTAFSCISSLRIHDSYSSLLFSKCYLYSKNNMFLLKNHVGSRVLYEIKSEIFRSFYTISRCVLFPESDLV